VALKNDLRRQVELYHHRSPVQKVQLRRYNKTLATSASGAAVLRRSGAALAAAAAAAAAASKPWAPPRAAAAAMATGRPVAAACLPTSADAAAAAADLVAAAVSVPPPTTRELTARVEHVLISDPGLLSAVLSAQLQVPRRLVLELMRFGAVYYSPVMPRPKDASVLSEEKLKAALAAHAAGVKVRAHIAVSSFDFCWHQPRETVALVVCTHTSQHTP
jgi:hypothetical protein